MKILNFKAYVLVGAVDLWITQCGPLKRGANCVKIGYVFPQIAEWIDFKSVNKT
jgi:hypothetical protein